MKKNALRIISFALMLLAAIYAIQYAMDYAYNKRVKQKFTTIFNHQLDPEVMIFGSSVAYHQFDPAIIEQATGKTAYNMGFDGLFFVQYNSLMKEFLSYSKTCKVAIIGCDFDNLGKNKLITRPDLFMAYLNNRFVYESLHDIEPEKIFRARYIPGYKFTILNRYYYKHILLDMGSDPLSGYNPIQSSFAPTAVKAAFNGNYEEHIYTELKSTIAQMTSKGIKVVLVMTPVFDEGYKLIANADFIKSKYKALANKNVYFLDYTTDSLCNKREYFSNFSHLNMTGATRFSNIFSKDLLNIIHE